MKATISWKDTTIIGFMLFALFFGAGNLVFPPMLGQSAGANVWEATLGFLVTGVGLPLICVIAFGFSAKPDLLTLTSRIHPWFAVIYTTMLYLTIGPLFAMPRTGTVAFEIGIKPFVAEGSELTTQIIFTVIYFGLSCLFSLTPSRIIDIVGKILTPALLAFLVILAAASILQPLGSFQSPIGSYTDQAFYHGFQEGYLTMDALAAFVFGIIVIEAVRARGATTKRQVMLSCIKAALISAAILAFIYSFLSILGASSVERLGLMANGGEVLTEVSSHYFGRFGGFILGCIVMLACLTTVIGLTTSCSTYLHKLFPAVPYRAFAIGMSIFSAVLANFGLNEMIAISAPVLTILYPLAIIIMVLTFLHPLFKGKRPIYFGSLLLTFIFSLLHELGRQKVPTYGIHEFFMDNLPLYEQGLGWVLPAILGALLGLMLTWFGIGRQTVE